MAITVQYPSKVYPSPFSKKAAVSKFAAAPAGARHLILSWGDNAPQKQRKNMEKTQVSICFFGGYNWHILRPSIDVFLINNFPAAPNSLLKTHEFCSPNT